MNQVITIEEIKKRNNSKRKLFHFIRIMSLVFLPVAFFVANGTYEIDKNITMALLAFVPFCLASPIIFTVFTSLIRKNKKYNTNIENNEFVIIEDKIYDKLKVHSSAGDNTHYHYYIFTKMYGKISVSFTIYNNANKDDSVFLFLYSTDNKITKFDSNINEHKRNSKFINYVFLASADTLDSDLANNLIPYDEAIADNIFNERIKYQINHLKETKKYVKCKHCSKKYNHKTHLDCPKCGCAFAFDITDILYNFD